MCIRDRLYPMTGLGLLMNNSWPATSKVLQPVFKKEANKSNLKFFNSSFYKICLNSKSVIFLERISMGVELNSLGFQRGMPKFKEKTCIYRGVSTKKFHRVMVKSTGNPWSQRVNSKKFQNLKTLSTEYFQTIGFYRF